MTPIEKRQARAKLLIIFAILALAFGGWEAYRRYALVVTGTIVSSAPAEKGAIYTMTDPAGTSFEFPVAGTDASLPKDLPAGTRVTKARGELTWMKNDQRIEDFPIAAYFGLPVLLFAFGVWSWARYRR